VLGTADARGAVVPAVRRHGRDLALDHLEQRRHLTGVISGIVGQHAGDDLAGAGVDRNVELSAAPTSSPHPDRRLRQPLVGPVPLRSASTCSSSRENSTGFGW
jgi:hypothetical protein